MQTLHAVTHTFTAFSLKLYSIYYFILNSNMISKSHEQIMSILHGDMLYQVHN